MKVSDILARIANTRYGQKIAKWATQPNKDRLLNHTLPQVETVLSTGCYIWSTAKQKDIDKERKQLLQIQNVGSGAVGLVLAGAANRWIGNKGEEIIKYIDPKKVDPKSLRQISTGIRVGLPILTTAVCMRFLIPSFIALFSGKIMDKAREKKGLNISA
jgi:hypothetical protein